MAIAATHARAADTPPILDETASAHQERYLSHLNPRLSDSSMGSMGVGQVQIPLHFGVAAVSSAETDSGDAIRQIRPSHIISPSDTSQATNFNQEDQQVRGISEPPAFAERLVEGGEEAEHIAAVPPGLGQPLLPAQRRSVTSEPGGTAESVPGLMSREASEKEGQGAFYSGTDRIPIPGAVLLSLIALIGLVAVARRKIPE